MIDVSVNIDYFSGTFFDGTDTPLKHPNYMPLWTERPKGLNGYNLAWVDDSTGFIRAINTDRPDMGLFITGGGQSLDRLAEQTGEPTRLKAAVRSGLDYAKCTRLDVCMDIYDGGRAAHHFKEQAMQNGIKTSARSIRFYHGQKAEQGVTTYLGAQTGLRMIRLYDKKAESKGRIPATRIEVQTRAAYARQLWQNLYADPSIPNLTNVTVSAIRGVLLASNVDAIEDALDGAIADIVPSRLEKDTDLKAWLLRQVLPSFWRNWVETNEDELMLWFVEEYKRMKGIDARGDNPSE